jgi:hypothetical protein
MAPHATPAQRVISFHSLGLRIARVESKRCRSVRGDFHPYGAVY